MMVVSCSQPFPARLSESQSAPPPQPLDARGPGGAGLLAERAVMVVEDEGIVALDIEMALEEVGAEVMGPFLTLGEANAALNAGVRPDAVVLDVNIGGEMVFPLAGRLVTLGVPFLFHTANGDVPELSEGFPGVPVCRKPVRLEALVAAVAGLVRSGEA